MQLVSELRQLMPRIATEAEQARVRTNDEWFARQQAHATRELAELICSDVPERALPPVTLSDCIRDWRWCASTLFLDLKPVLGVNATVRCIASVLRGALRGKPGALHGAQLSEGNGEANSAPPTYPARCASPVGASPRKLRR